ncbi:MAG: hypothetical protein ACPGQR_00585 [Marinirhabdus sp.]
MIEKILEYKNVLASLPQLIDGSPIKKGYIIKKTGVSSPTFYRKLKHLTFTPDEVLSIVRLIIPEEAYLHDLKESIDRGKKDDKLGNAHTRDKVVEEIEQLLS